MTYGARCGENFSIISDVKNLERLSIGQICGPKILPSEGYAVGKFSD